MISSTFAYIWQFDWLTDWQLDKGLEIGSLGLSQIVITNLNIELLIQVVQ